MHPRTKLEIEIEETLTEAFPGKEVYVNLMSEIDPNIDEAIIIYVAEEDLSRVNGRGTGVAGAPVKRHINVEIVASTILTAVNPQEEKLASRRSNALAREIGITINSKILHLDPQGERQEHDVGDTIRVATVMTYKSEINDKMED